jgi:hypothetical protein
MRRPPGGDEDQGAGADCRARPQMACPLRARSAGQRRELTVTPGQPDTAAHLRTGRLTRCANRPSKQEVNTGPRGRGGGPTQTRRADDIYASGYQQ